MAEARRSGPFVAWRDSSSTLRIESLRAGEPLTVGRANENAVMFDHVVVSREHAEILLRAHGKPGQASVMLLDLRSKHGTTHRAVTLERGATQPVGPLQLAPSHPAPPARLDPGDHDVKLANEVWLRIGGVRVDRGATGDRAFDVPAPTRRERDVLVELCRPRFFAAGTAVATPSNAQIAARLIPPIKSERVSDLVSQMYVKYDMTGTKEQNRVALVEFALEHRLVLPEDYL